MKPSTKACGEAKPPAPAKIVDITATPKTPPTSRIALFVPEAWPARCGATTLSSALADGAKTRPMPMPAIMNGGRRLEFVESTPAAIASHASAAPCIARPSAISPRGPRRSARTPAIGLVIAVAPVQTSMRTPASNGA